MQTPQIKVARELANRSACQVQYVVVVIVNVVFKV
jgi:hypothetical protein